jgi:hypothetical protein
MRTVQRILFGLIMLLGAGCAIQDAAQTSNNGVGVPVLVASQNQVFPTLPPEQVYFGACDPESSALINWLSYTAPRIDEFRNKFAQIPSLTESEYTAHLTRLLELRDSMYAASTPDCGMLTQLIATSAMDRGIIAFRNLRAGQNINMAVLLTEVNEMLVSVQSHQEQLRTAVLGDSATTATPSP